METIQGYYEQTGASASGKVLMRGFSEPTVKLIGSLMRMGDQVEHGFIDTNPGSCLQVAHPKNLTIHGFNEKCMEYSILP